MGFLPFLSPKLANTTELYNPNDTLYFSATRLFSLTFCVTSIKTKCRWLLTQKQMENIVAG